MNAHALNDHAEKWVHNATFTFLSRAAMLIASLIILPYAMWQLQEAKGTLKRVEVFSIQADARFQALDSRFDMLERARDVDRQEQGAIKERVRDLEETARRLEDAQAEILEILRGGVTPPTSPRR